MIRIFDRIIPIAVIALFLFAIWMIVSVIIGAR